MPDASPTPTTPPPPAPVPPTATTLLHDVHAGLATVLHRLRTAAQNAEEQIAPAALQLIQALEVPLAIGAKHLEALLIQGAETAAEAAARAVVVAAMKQLPVIIAMAESAIQTSAPLLLATAPASPLGGSEVAELGAKVAEVA
jgi:hypothetical protein